MIKTYNVKEIMQILDIHTPRIIYDKFASGELKGFRNHTHKWLCLEVDLMDYINRKKEESYDTDYQSMVGGA